MMATWSPRVARWRSMQLCATLVRPPSNHLIDTWGKSKDVFFTLVNGLNQSMGFASAAQKPSGSLIERSYMAAYLALSTWARLRHSPGTSWVCSLMLPLLDGARFVPASFEYHYAPGILGATRHRMSHFGQGRLIEINQAKM